MFETPVGDKIIIKKHLKMTILKMIYQAVDNKKNNKNRKIALKMFWSMRIIQVWILTSSITTMWKRELKATIIKEGGMEIV